MAATRIIPLHINKGKTLAKSLDDRTNYAKNPEKTEKGELVTAYKCDPITVDEDFLLSKRKYLQINGRQQRGNVIAYQIRQSFKPGEVSPEDANKIGRELAMRFTKGNHAFIVATHTDKAHIHNHILFNSTSYDGTKKFKNFWLSSLAVQRISDMICLENGLSVIEPKPYRERMKRTDYPKRVNHRTTICSDISTILKSKPKTFDDFLQALEAAGYEVKQGKNVSIRGKEQKRFIRLSSLPAGFNECDIHNVIIGKQVIPKNPFEKAAPKISQLIELQDWLTRKGPAYHLLDAKFNVKQMASTLLYMRDHNLDSLDEVKIHAESLKKQRDSALAEVHSAEAELAEIAALRKHIINYSSTRQTYEAYRKAGYSKKFLEAHREEIQLHKAAKDAFNQYSQQHLPTVKELNTRYAAVLFKKKEDYANYRKLSSESREALNVVANCNAMVNGKQLEQQERPDSSVLR